MANVKMIDEEQAPEEETVEEEIVPDEELDAELDEDDENPLRIEDMDPKEELWPQGPTVASILEWKEKYGDIYVTSITIDKHMVWRTMNRFEYKQMVKEMEKASQQGGLTAAELTMFQEEYVASLCLLFPKVTKAELVQDMAGVATMISQEVMDNSGFVPLEIRQL